MDDSGDEIAQARAEVERARARTDMRFEAMDAAADRRHEEQMAVLGRIADALEALARR
jgi:hypothetical protein